MSRNFSLQFIAVIALYSSINFARSFAPLRDWPPPPFPEKKSWTKHIESTLGEQHAYSNCTSSELEKYTQRNALSNEDFRWKRFHLFIDDTFDLDDRVLINNAAYRLQQAVPCLKFGIWLPGQKPFGDYVHIKKGLGCWSDIGKIGGAQDMSLGEGCMQMVVILHEMMHALGLGHEQCRHDRDDYVEILWENIIPEEKHNFRKGKPEEWTTFGIPYNQNSIMHYWAHASSKNGKPTIVSKTNDTVGPIGDSIPHSDILKLRKMYKC